MGQDWEWDLRPQTSGPLVQNLQYSASGYLARWEGCYRSDSKGRHIGQATRLELWFPPGHPAAAAAAGVWGGHFLSSLAHPCSSGRLPAPGAPIPGLRPSAFKAFPTAPASPPQLPFPRAPLPQQSCQPLAKAQAGAFDPDFRARGQGSLPYLGSLRGALYAPQPHTLEATVPASGSPGGGRRGCTATSPHEAQPMGGGASRQPNRQPSSPGYSQSHSVPPLLLARRGWSV